jgi:TRAP-type C4-dicarboxylate transport system permease small subunit
MVRLETPRRRPARRLTFLLVRLPMHVLGLVLLAGVGLNLANVVARYVFSAPIFWAEEVLVYAMIWAVFIALPAVTFQNAHLRMDLFYLAMPGRLRWLVDLLCVLIFLACGVFAAFYSYRVVALLGANNQTSVAAGLPMAAVHAALPIGFALMIVAVAARIVWPPPEAK